MPESPPTQSNAVAAIVPSDSPDSPVAGKIAHATPPLAPGTLTWRKVTSRSLFAITLVGVLLHGSIRDQVYGVSILFYMVPPVVLGIATLFWWRLEDRPKSQLGRRARQIYVMSLLIWVIGQSYVYHPRKLVVNAPHQVKLIFWNVWSWRAGIPAVLRAAATDDPDLIILTEAYQTPDRIHEYLHLLPDHHFRELAFGLRLFTKGDVVARERFDRLPGLYAEILKLKLHHRTFTLIFADICGNPFVSREEPMRLLSQLANERAQSGEPVIIVGDLNTPYESYFTTKFRPNFQHGFRDHGTGVTPTWPSMFPVLELDHLWCTQDIQILSCKHDWTWLSDHRPLRATLCLP